MDKIRIMLAAIKKHHFWILCGVIVVLGIAVWLVATGSLAKKYDARKRTLDGKFGAVQSICGRPNHPNQGVVDATNREIGKLKDDVLNSWILLYEKQKRENPLPAVLKEDFITAFAEDEIEVPYRERYQNFIELHIPKLFETVDVVRPKENGTATSATGGAGRTARSSRPRRPRGVLGAAETFNKDAEMVGTVVWDANDRKKLEERFNWRKTPSTLQVRLAQEDLWVYEALMRIIRNTNEGCNTNYNAAVKQIEALEIAQDAVQSSHSANNVVVGLGAVGGEDTAAVGEGMMPLHRLMEGPGGMGGMGREDAAAESPGQREANRLISGRYVDSDGRPLSADDDPPFAEYKIMPIRMKLVMNQTKIPKLLVECANSSMPIEVRRVRLRPGEGGGPLDLTRLTAAAEPTTAGGIPLTTYRERGPRDSALPHTLAQTDRTQTGELDIPVEIQGFIYIYNSPDRNALGTGAVAEKSMEVTVEETPAALTEAAPTGQPTTTPAANTGN